MHHGNDANVESRPYPAKGLLLTQKFECRLKIHSLNLPFFISLLLVTFYILPRGTLAGRLRYLEWKLSLVDSDVILST